MNSVQFPNEPLSVEAQIVNDRVYPQIITWRKKTCQVISVGRQWAEADGTHILVELHDGSRMEVQLGGDLAWRLTRYWPPVFMA